MKPPLPSLRRHAARAVGLVLVAALAMATRLPELPARERAELSSRFRFRAFELATPPGEGAPASVRAVHPSLAHISAWISSVGAGVALADVDGDGLPNDLCLVEPRTDAVSVQPVPGTGARYEPFLLAHDHREHRPGTVAPMGCLPGDLDEDGTTDLLVYYWGRTPVAFLRRAAGGAARGSPATPALDADAFLSRDVHPGGERWFTNAALLADVDGDGRTDLVVGNYFPDGARILDPDASGVESMQHSMSRARNGGTNRLLRRVEGGCAEAPCVHYDASVLDPGGSGGWTLALGAADLDGDLRPEIYVANDFGPDRLLHNRSRAGTPALAPVQGRGGLRVPASKVLGRDSFKGMGVDFGDLDGDGILDIYVSNIAAEWALEESHFAWLGTGDGDGWARGVAPFREGSEPLGLSRSDWGWDARIADFDNDGVPEVVQATGFVQGEKNRWPELHELAMANDDVVRNPASWLRMQPGDDLSGHVPTAFFVQGRRGVFHDLAADVGLGRVQVSRGIALADVDGDGDLDMAVANQWEPSRFYRNDAPGAVAGTGAGLVLDLQVPAPGGGPLATRAALGAQARLRRPDGRRLVGQVDGGSGHGGKRAPEIHFGLGDHPAGAAVDVELRWRDAAGAHRETIGLRAGRYVLLLTPEGVRHAPGTAAGGPRP